MTSLEGTHARPLYVIPAQAGIQGGGNGPPLRRAFERGSLLALCSADPAPAGSAFSCVPIFPAAAEQERLIVDRCLVVCFR